jgi:phosphoserine phosphatase
MNDARSREDDLAALLATTRTLGATSELGQSLEVLVAAACSLFGAQVGAFWHCEDDGLTLTLPSLHPAPRLQTGQGLAGRCALAGTMLVVDDLDDAEDASDVWLLDPRPEARAGAALNLPLLTDDGRVLGVLQLLHRRPHGFPANVVFPAQILAALGTLTLQRVRLAGSAQQTARLHNEVEVARKIQRSTLPGNMPQVPGYDLHGHFQPATYAGGDLFDVVRLERGVFLLLGDATGHGFGPALSAIQMQGMLRVAFRLGADLDHAYMHVNNQLAEDLPADRFITAFMGFLDADAHTVSYHSAGQGPILHFQASENRCGFHEPDTFPMGVLALDQVKAATTLQMAPGDVLALISDGVYEQPNPAEEEFGRDRVGAVLQRCHTLPMAELCQELLAAVKQFAGSCAQADDITLLLVRRLS